MLEPTKINRGSSDFRSKGRNASVTLAAPMTLTFSTSRRLSRLDGSWLRIPALLTRTSRWPYFVAKLSAAASTDLSSVTSI